MSSLCLYNGRVYNKVYSFKHNDYDFTLCKDNNKYIYFKHDVVNDKDVYTPYDRWLSVFELEDKNKDKLDKFIEHLNNKNIKSKKQIENIVNSYVCGKKKHKRKILIFNKYIILLIISLSALLFSGVTLYNWYSEGKDVHNLMNDVLKNTEIKENIAFTATEIPEVSGDAAENHKYGEDYWNYMKTTMISVDFDELKRINSDTRGWIYVNNTNVNYPFVQSGDNEFYLNHSYDKSYNVAGWLFADYRSDFNKFQKNTVIYGHGRVDQVMFGSLEKVLDESWYTDKENQIIKLSTPEKNTLWQIASIYTIPSESYYLTHTFENDQSYQKFIDTMLSRSIYDFGNKVTTKDKLLTLSTCLDYNGNRIVIQAKLIKEQKR